MTNFPCSFFCKYVVDVIAVNVNPTVVNRKVVRCLCFNSLPGRSDSSDVIFRELFRVSSASFL